VGRFIMNSGHKTAFVSYSWDNEEHQNWVMHLVNTLLNSGVVAEMDVFITQRGTVNLNNMMVSNIRDKDYFIVVLTKNYAKKSDSQQGGVGFETTLSLPLLQQNLKKVILLLREGDHDVSVPFHLKGYHILDFRDDNKFEDSMKELLHRIYEVPLYEVGTLGNIPDLKPRKVVYQKESNPFDDFEIPIFRTYTDLEKEKFLNKSFNEINDLLNSFFIKVKESEHDFDFISEKIHEKKYIYKLYMNGKQRTGIKIWVGGHFGYGINLLYGNNPDFSNDNTTNDIIRCEINDNNEMELKMSMSMFGNQTANNPKDIVLEIWNTHLQQYLR
jgi:hypothetical protein